MSDTDIIFKIAQDIGELKADMAVVKSTIIEIKAAPAKRSSDRRANLAVIVAIASLVLTACKVFGS